MHIDKERAYKDKYPLRAGIPVKLFLTLPATWPTPDRLTAINPEY